MKCPILYIFGVQSLWPYESRNPPKHTFNLKSTFGQLAFRLISRRWEPRSSGTKSKALLLPSSMALINLFYDYFYFLEIWIFNFSSILENRITTKLLSCFRNICHFFSNPYIELCILLWSKIFWQRLSSFLPCNALLQKMWLVVITFFVNDLVIVFRFLPQLCYHTLQLESS